MNVTLEHFIPFAFACLSLGTLRSNLSYSLPEEQCRYGPIGTKPEFEGYGVGKNA